MQTDIKSFPIFLSLWNQRQGMRTPDVHFRIAHWLETLWRRGERRLLLMAFRSCGKSTLTGLFCAWLLFRQPELRILVLAADFALAKKMVRNVKRIIERHPLTAHLKPAAADQWGSDRFTVNRPLELRDPSMLARGISSNITGSRADVIICDDVEVPNTCDSAEKRRDLRERLAETAYVLVPGGLQIYVGTPHTFETIYDPQGFLEGYAALKVPVLDEAGASAWPERFSAADIERIRRTTGPNKFTSQMMLVPVNIAEGRLNPDLLRRYEGEPDYAKEMRALYVNGERAVSASAWWDPAFGGASGDASVLAVVFADEGGRYYLHRAAYLSTSSSDEDEATSQCVQVARIAKDLLLPSVALEINGLGRFLPGLLRQELGKARVPCSVREISSRRPKDLRILEAFDAVLAARVLYAHESVYATPFLTEMREWRPGASRGRDDGLDAVAGALSLEPVRLRAQGPASLPEWRAGDKQRQAKTQLEV
ncbi:MAG: hypothetical protein EOM26_05540 [Alphaproteobacteria bacterium]|nr:hypothetical protein [Alphaproteobacteria bacterium]